MLRFDLFENGRPWWETTFGMKRRSVPRRPETILRDGLLFAQICSGVKLRNERVTNFILGREPRLADLNLGEGSEISDEALAAAALEGRTEHATRLVVGILHDSSLVHLLGLLKDWASEYDVLRPTGTSKVISGQRQLDV